MEFRRDMNLDVNHVYRLSSDMRMSMNDYTCPPLLSGSRVDELHGRTKPGPGPEGRCGGFGGSIQTRGEGH